jgi:membrane protease YdiL (CAAX protease family)
VDGSDGRQAATAPTRSWPLLGTLTLLVAVNVLNNSAAPDLYVLWACVAIVGLVLLARADGLRRRDWGFGPVTVRAARAAAVLAAATAAAMLVGTQLPGVTTAYDDARVEGMGAADVAFAALIRVPLGTAFLEEMAFRGVLLAMLTRRYGTAWAVAGSSLAFGAWHLLPSLDLTVGNAAIGAVLGTHCLVTAGIAMVAAGLAGAFLCLLRIRYDHLIAPLAVHVTTNSMGYVLAWIMVSS